VSLNVNAPDAGAVQFCRLDQLAPNSPPRFISSIAPDPANPARAFLSYDGYNSNTKDFPGHVFEVTFTPGANGGCPTAAVWRDLADVPAGGERRAVARVSADSLTAICAVRQGAARLRHAIWRHSVRPHQRGARAAHDAGPRVFLWRPRPREERRPHHDPLAGV